MRDDCALSRLQEINMSQDPSPTPDPTPAPPVDPAPSDPKPDEGKTFTQADVDRIIEGRFKKYADYDTVKQQLAELQQASQTETERAINEAKSAASQEARAAVLDEIAPRLVAAEFRAASANRLTAEQLAGFLEDIDPKKYLTESGEVDTERVAKKVDLLAPAEERRAAPSFGGGVRKTDKPDPGPGLARLRAAYSDQ